MGAIAESSDDYPRVVAHLNANWRIIECRARVQWILQRRHGATKTPAGARWDNRSYCRTSEALRRCCREEQIAIDPAAMDVLAALPDWIESDTVLMRALEVA